MVNINGDDYSRLPGRDADPSPPSSVEVKNKSRAIPLLSLRAFVAHERVKPTYYNRLKTQFSDITTGMETSRFTA
jgi:hypothetical protein